MKTKIITKDGNTIFRVSRWIKRQTNYNPSKRNSLWYYVTDGNGYKEGQTCFDQDTGLYLDFFRWNGRTWAIEQFLRLDYPIMYNDKSGKLNYLSGYDSENYYNPILIEIDETGDYIRVYEEK